MNQSILLRCCCVVFLCGYVFACAGGSKGHEQGDLTEDAIAHGTGNEALASVRWLSDSYTYGTISEGELVIHRFQLVNTSDESLYIRNAYGTCGCTLPSWPREPIAAGDTATIEVRFDSKGKNGQQNKKITIIANTSPESHTLWLLGEVTEL